MGLRASRHVLPHEDEFERYVRKNFRCCL